MEEMHTAIIESPYSAPDQEGVARNLGYLGRCIQDSILRGEAPWASHGFYTLFLDDKVPEQRHLGMKMGFTWAERADIIAFYVDFGMSPGMMQHLEVLVSRRTTQHVTFRALDDEHDAAWMRLFIDGLPGYIRQHLDNVRVG